MYTIRCYSSFVLRCGRNPVDIDQCGNTAEDGPKNAVMSDHGRRRNCVSADHDTAARYSCSHLIFRGKFF